MLSCQNLINANAGRGNSRQHSRGAKLPDRERSIHLNSGQGHQKDQVHLTTRIVLDSGVNGFAENKETARAIRLGQLLPALDSGADVVIDVGAVRYATQSFVHALIGEGLQKYGEEFLERVEFKNCSPQLQSVIELVVGYSLSGFPTAQSV